jgi:hypothetical protein
MRKEMRMRPQKSSAKKGVWQCRSRRQVCKIVSWIQRDEDSSQIGGEGQAQD